MVLKQRNKGVFCQTVGGKRVVRKNIVPVVAVQPVLRGDPQESVAGLADVEDHALRKALLNGERFE